MIRLISRPGLLTSAVVAALVASGIAFGVTVVSVSLALRFATRKMRGRG